MTQEKTSILGFPGSSVVKNQPSNAGDRGSIPHLGRSHTPWTTKPCVPQLLRPTCPTAPAPGKPPQWEAHTAAREQEELSRNEDSTQPKKKKKEYFTSLCVTPYPAVLGSPELQGRNPYVKQNKKGYCYIFCEILISVVHHIFLAFSFLNTWLLH